jgi:transposase
VRISDQSEVIVEPDLDKVVEQSADAAVTFLPLHVKGTRLVGLMGVSFEETLSRVLISVLVHGTYLLTSSDKNLSAEDIVLGYKQLMEVERAFRMLKKTVSLRPIYHSKDERIRSHVLLCWLALLLVRIAETKTDLSWTGIRRQTQQLHLGGFLNKKAVF